MKKILLILLLIIPLLVVAQKKPKPKDSTYFMGTEDTLFNNAQDRGVGAVMMIVHRDYKCRVTQAKSTSEAPITTCSHWYTYTKAFKLTDTGWKIIK